MFIMIKSHYCFFYSFQYHPIHTAISGLEGETSISVSTITTTGDILCSPPTSPGALLRLEPIIMSAVNNALTLSTLRYDCINHRSWLN